jgi:hypothetical protein
MFKGTHFNGSRAILLDPVDAAPWLGSGPTVPAGQWAGHDPVLRNYDRSIILAGAAEASQTPPVLWVVGDLDLTAHRFRDAPEPYVCSDGQVISWEFDQTELSTVHLQPYQASTIQNDNGYSARDQRSDRGADSRPPQPTVQDRSRKSPPDPGSDRGRDLPPRPAPSGEQAITGPVATAPPRRLDRMAVAGWRRTAGELVAGPVLAAHLAARPAAPDRLDLVPVAGGSEQQMWADALLDSIIARQRLISHLQARQAADLSELERNYPGLVEFLPAEIGFALNVTENWAGRQIDSARRVRLRLPATWTAWDAGNVATEKACYLAEATKDLDRYQTRRVEKSVLPKAPSQTLPEFRAAVRRAIIAADPEGAGARHESAVADRRIRKVNCEDGMAQLYYYSTATDVQPFGKPSSRSPRPHGRQRTTEHSISGERTHCSMSAPSAVVWGAPMDTHCAHAGARRR